jgi:hypothetical protein
MNVKQTLNNRASSYGSFEDNAKITQGLIEILQSAPNYYRLGQIHKESVHMICHKLARMVCGDVNYSDNPRDIAGYATLLMEYLEKKEKESEDQKKNQ